MVKLLPITETAMNPRIAYAQKKSPAQMIVIGIDIVIVLLALIFTIIPTVIISTYNPDTGTVISQEAKDGGKRTIYTTTFDYNGDIINSKETSYKSTKDTGVVDGSIDLLVSKNGDIEIAKAVKRAQTISGAIFLIATVFFIGTVIMSKRLNKVFIDNPAFSDAKAIVLLYSPQEWKKAYPQLADKINPATGNIDSNYQPPLYETTKEKEMRFNSTIERYKKSSQNL